MHDLPAVSIILTTHNSEQTLKRAIDSVCNQIFTNWELICVDNASTDTTVDIIEEYSRTDQRIRSVFHQEDEGLYWSRRDGIAQTAGEYLMFLDADDWLERNALSDIVGMMRKQGVDLLQYRSKVVPATPVSQEMLTGIDAFIRPYAGRVEHVDLVNFCYAEDRFSFSIWNKIYKSSIFKKVLPDMEKEYIIIGEDVILVFMYLLEAKSYYGDRDGKQYHNYLIGTGLSSEASIPLSSLRVTCSGGTAAALLQRYLEKKNLQERYQLAMARCRQRLLNDALYTWGFRLKEEDRTAGLDTIFQFWNPRDVIPQAARDYGYLAAQFGDCARRLELFKPARREIKTIGLMGLRMCNGGVERVNSLLLPLWQELGYRIVLLIEAEESSEDYPIPKGIERLVLPKFSRPEEFPYLARCHALMDAVRDYHIDIMVDSQYYSVSNVWDCMAVRSMGVPILIAVHNAFLQVAMYGKDALDIRFPGYAMANGLITLSQLDQKTATFLGYQSWFIPNPVDPRLREIEQSNLDNHTVLYIGRLEDQKRPLEMLRIFAKVAQAVPDARLIVVGRADTPEWDEKIHAEIQRLGIGDRVELAGFQTNTYPYFKQGGVFLMPSLFEGFPMAMLESKATGLPCVSYHMPYLEFQQYGKGMLVAEQGDVDGAAQLIINLFADSGYRKKVGQEARESFEYFASFDLSSMWNEVFDAVTQRSVDMFATEKGMKDGRDILETYRFFRNVGQQNALSEIETELNREGVKKVLKLHAIASMFRHVGWKGKIKIIGKLILRCFGIKRPFYCEEYEVRVKILRMISNIR